MSAVWTISCDNSEKVRDRMSVTINHYLVIGRCIRAFDWYWPRWPWMTLNGVIAFILRFFHRIRLLWWPISGNFITVVEYRPIMSVNIISQFHSSTFGHNLPTLQRGLCDSWATCPYWLTVLISMLTLGHLIKKITPELTPEITPSFDKKNIPELLIRLIYCD